MTCGYGDMKWQKGAACRSEHVSTFFPSNQGDNYKEAIRICGTCPVQEECLQFALHHFEQGEQWGVWGGKTRNERVRIKKRDKIHTTRVCAECGGQYVAEGGRQRYCGRVCRQLHNKAEEQMKPGRIRYVGKSELPV